MGIAEDYVTKQVVDKLSEKLTIVLNAESQRVKAEFKRMENYINTLEARVVELEKRQLP